MEALGNLSFVLQAEGCLEKAETVVARGMELALCSAELAYNLGTVRQEAGRHSEGVFRNEFTMRFKESLLRTGHGPESGFWRLGSRRKELQSGF